MFRHEDLALHDSLIESISHFKPLFLVIFRLEVL
jgi:hypothetical protein